MKRIAMIAGLALLAGCGETDAPKAEQKAEKAKELSGGEYELTKTVTAFRSTDGSGAAPPTTIGEESVRKVCAQSGKKPDPALFAAEGDECTDLSSFVSNGRLSMQLNCKRPGKGGYVSIVAGGTFTADSFESEATTSTAFSGEGDYQMTETIAGRRLGDCPAS